MKKLMFVLIALALLVIPSAVIAGEPTCTTIQDGVLTYSAGHYLEGEPLVVGYDPYGYNYQAHLFNGYYPNVYLGRDGFPPYKGDIAAYLAMYPEAANQWYWYPDVQVQMKWNDAWISNKDCDGDGKLDRHYGHESYIGSGAWETNHQSGGKGKDHWIYFVKIVAVPEDAYVDAPYDIYGNGTWYTADGTKIGPQIWGSFAVLQRVESGVGVYDLSPAGPGFGKWK